MVVGLSKTMRLRTIHGPMMTAATIQTAATQRTRVARSTPRANNASGSARNAT
jgi:hypothetical protein